MRLNPGLCLIFWVCIGLSQCLAQSCTESPNALKKEVSETRDPQVLLRGAEAAGTPLLPILKTLSGPNQPQWGIPGAAQVARARLGDPGALEELNSELTKSPTRAIEKLVMVRSEASLSILMQYLITHKDPAKRIKDYGDYMDDPLEPALKGMVAMLEDPPYSRPSTLPTEIDGWQKWWEQSKPPRIVPISEGLADPVSSCLARLAEYGDADPVSELYTRRGKNSIPVLQRLARLGDKRFSTANFKTAPGLAQTLLAREGDRAQFEKIVKELDDASYSDAVAKLQYIGSPASFEALLHALSLRTFMSHSNRDPKYIENEGKKLQVSIMAALSNMVSKPPLPPDAPPTPENRQTWAVWWEVNKNKAF